MKTLLLCSVFVMSAAVANAGPTDPQLCEVVRIKNSNAYYRADPDCGGALFASGNGASVMKRPARVSENDSSDPIDPKPQEEDVTDPPTDTDPVLDEEEQDETKEGGKRCEGNCGMGLGGGGGNGTGAEGKSPDKDDKDKDKDKDDKDKDKDKTKQP